jgi:hypothetical protein
MRMYQTFELMSWLKKNLGIKKCKLNVKQNALLLLSPLKICMSFCPEIKFHIKKKFPI